MYTAVDPAHLVYANQSISVEGVSEIVNHEPKSAGFRFLRGLPIAAAQLAVHHALLFLQKRDELERVWTASSKLFVYEVTIALINVGSSILAIVILNLAVERSIRTNVCICYIIVHRVFSDNSDWSVGDRRLKGLIYVNGGSPSAAVGGCLIEMSTQ
jgi:hypothetical protein